MSGWLVYSEVRKGEVGVGDGHVRVRVRVRVAKVSLSQCEVQSQCNATVEKLVQGEIR